MTNCVHTQWHMHMHPPPPDRRSAPRHLAGCKDKSCNAKRHSTATATVARAVRHSSVHTWVQHQTPHYSRGGGGRGAKGAAPVAGGLRTVKHHLVVVGLEHLDVPSTNFLPVKSVGRLGNLLPRAKKPNRAKQRSRVSERQNCMRTVPPKCQGGQANATNRLPSTLLH